MGRDRDTDELGEPLNHSSTHSLPEEVVEEILSRTSPKSLARFRSVCKSWHHLTYTQTFISLHLKNYTTLKLILGPCSWSDVCSMYFLPLPPPTGGRYSDNDGTSQMMYRRDLPRLFGGSCNGIVCLYSDRADEPFALWNPATNEVKKIPNPTPFMSSCTVGFGFDPKTNDYKILKIVYKPILYFNSNLTHRVARIELYSMRKSSWKKLDSHDFWVVRNGGTTDVVCSLPFTDARIVCTLVRTSNWEVLAFDMSTETYQVISVSPTLDTEIGDYKSFSWPKRCIKLFPYKETIALGIVHPVGRETTHCHVWVLNDFKFTPQSRSWSKILTTDASHRHFMPVGCLGSSQFLFQEFGSMKLFKFGHGNNMMMELGVIPPAYVTTGIYKERLVPIDDSKAKAGDSSICL